METEEKELEKLIKEQNIKVEILPPGIAIGAIETPIEKYVRMKRTSFYVDGRTLRDY